VSGSRRSGRAWVYVLILVLGILAGLAAAVGYSRLLKGTPKAHQMQGAPGAGGPGSHPPRERKILYWRAPMDPNYTSDKPGKSPMGMDLVPVYADEAQAATGPMIRIDPVTIQNMGIRTATLRRGPLVKTIRTVGRVDYDEQLLAFINTKFTGWIEKLYVSETGQQVNKGQPLFDVYSPDLYSAQEEYLAALRGLDTLANASEAIKEQARRLLDAARIKLRYLDVTDQQIDELERTKEIRKSLVIHSPAEGIVTEKTALEGMYVNPGMKLYTIADLSRVWVYVDVYEYELPWVRIAQEATVTLPYIPGKEFTGKVVYIYPYLNEKTRVVHVRLEFGNPTLELKPGMYANVRLARELQGNALLIPRDGYIDSGTRNVAFVYLGDGKFLPRVIQVGVHAEDEMVEVLDGLAEGERVVTSGEFLLDSESRLREAMAKMREPNIGHEMPMRHPATSTARAPAAESGPASTAPAAIQGEMDRITEHYLAMQRQLASDSTTGVGAGARGIAAASEAMLRRVPELPPDARAPIEAALRKLHAAAQEITGARIAEDRVHLVALSDAMVVLLDHFRPDRGRWPKLYIFYCPMSKGKWVQTTERPTNPYYGFQMLRCGTLVESR
jgi:membrane fusion protein, copper/silver efflux system